MPAGLLVRSQNCTGWTPGVCQGCNVDDRHPLAPWFPGSVITFARARGDGSFDAPYLVFAPEASAPTKETFGTEDPRITLDTTTGLYHLFYTCYGPPALLCHATTRDPTAPYPGSWVRLGAVFPDKVGSKSGALLLRDAPPHYLIWGAGTIALATSDDLVTWTTINDRFIEARAGGFDDVLVESGPNPFLLSSGAYVFFHNSMNSSTGYDGGRPYNPEWVILNGTNVSHIVQRADAPMLSPVEGWEWGTAPFECNVGAVAFLEAAAPVDGEVDTFDLWFGGSDAVVGTARVKVALR